MDCRLVSGVHDDELGKAVADAVNGAHHLGAQAAAAHAEQVNCRDAFGPYLVGERLDMLELRLHPGGHVEPAEPVGNRPCGLAGGVSGPDRDVAAPDASYETVVHDASV